MVVPELRLRKRMMATVSKPATTAKMAPVMSRTKSVSEKIWCAGVASGRIMLGIELALSAAATPGKIDKAAKTNHARNAGLTTGLTADLPTCRT